MAQGCSCTPRQSPDTAGGRQSYQKSPPNPEKSGVGGKNPTALPVQGWWSLAQPAQHGWIPKLGQGTSHWHQPNPSVGHTAFLLKINTWISPLAHLGLFPFQQERWEGRRRGHAGDPQAPRETWDVSSRRRCPTWYKGGLAFITSATTKTKARECFPCFCQKKPQTTSSANNPHPCSIGSFLSPASCPRQEPQENLNHNQKIHFSRE